jgi:hypothetical protein
MELTQEHFDNQIKKLVSKSDFDEKIKDLVTKADLDEKLKGYPTKLDLDQKFQDYPNKKDLDEKLEAQTRELTVFAVEQTEDLARILASSFASERHYVDGRFDTLERKLGVGDQVVDF